MLRSIDAFQNKASADQYHMTISQAQVYCSSRSSVFFKLTADQVLVFDWITGACQVNLLKTGQDCLEGLKVNRIIPFFFYTSVFCYCILCIW